MVMVGTGGIICIRFKELERSHEVVTNIVIKSGSAGTVLGFKVEMRIFFRAQQTRIP